jgi:hypothetical protein
MKTMKFDDKVNDILNTEPELDWYKSEVMKRAGDKPTAENVMQALDQAWHNAGHARFKTDTLHNELMKTRGETNKKRKFMKSGYYPEGGEFDPEYMKHWLQREIMGEFVTKRDGPMPFYKAR